MTDKTYNAFMTEKFTVRNNGANFWTHFSKATIDFQNALGELIDNALSGAVPKEYGEGVDSIAIEISIEELASEIIVRVADHGTGIQKAALTGNPNVFELGFVRSGVKTGRLNEHGFGLKNAVALMTAGFERPFHLITTTLDDPKFYKIDGPIKDEMELNTTNSNDWNSGLSKIKNVKHGVKVVCHVSKEYFSTLYKRGNQFSNKIDRLGEHLGVMYSKFIAAGNTIYLTYKDQDATSFTTKEIPPIHVPFLVNEAAKTETYEIEFENGGKFLKATYTQGILDPSVKDATSGKGWPYPLKIYFQGSNSRGGVTLFIRERMIKSGLLKEIWPDKAGDVSYNNFLASLELPREISTTHNKTDVDPHDKSWQTLVEKIIERFPPEKVTKKQSEESLRQGIIKQIVNVKRLLKDKKPKKLPVWDGGGEIDIYFEDSDGPHFIETKIEKGRVEHVYQMLMYWDGLVELGKNPKEGTLIAAEITPNIEKALKHINQLRDKNGNTYNLKAEPMTGWLLPGGKN